jgi:hypothetical protein
MSPSRFFAAGHVFQASGERLRNRGRLQATTTDLREVLPCQRKMELDPGGVAQ